MSISYSNYYEKVYFTALFLAITLQFIACSSERDDTVPVAEPMLIIKFDPNQARINNLGEPSMVAVGNGAQSPIFNTISSHYVEISQSATTALDAGTILYHAPETTIGDTKAIDFKQSKIVT
ncbi:hypothetical protein [Flavobacterium sp.]|uniref:hypothetical protein n=1 Tax=Flavobacterium sp. TaxID=239 RepID=UPI0025E85350|nr:hypothetical protein [Flavobacterium sp.]